MTVEGKKRENKVYSTGFTYLEPLTCDSTVSYKICGFNYNSLEATVTLSDRNRKIDWDFGNSDMAIEKVDTAINILAQFRKDLIKAQKEYEKDFPKESK